MSEPREFNPKAALGDIKGRAYLNVANRVFWLTQEEPRYSLDTDLVHYDDKTAVVKATVTLYDEGGAVKRRASGYGRGHGPALPAQLAARYPEKAETAAIGRALAALGYGTLSAQTFDDTDGDHLADTPQPARGAARPATNGALPSRGETPTAAGLGSVGQAAPPSSSAPASPAAVGAAVGWDCSEDGEAGADPTQWAQQSPLHPAHPSKRVPPRVQFTGNISQRGQAFLEACQRDMNLDVGAISKALGSVKVSDYCRVADVPLEAVYERLWRLVHLDEPIPLPEPVSDGVRLLRDDVAPVTA